MELKEYEVQLALGTIDFRLAANETQSSIVLQDIIGRTDDIAVLYAVATNSKTNIYTLTLLATFPDAEEGVIISCAYHPSITLNILERWMKYPAIQEVQAVQRRVRAFQLASGISEKDALFVFPTSLYTKTKTKTGTGTGTDNKTWWHGIITAPPGNTSTQVEYTKWTTAGNNESIEMDDGRFKFTIEPDDITIYYSYDNSISIPAK